VRRLQAGRGQANFVHDGVAIADGADRGVASGAGVNLGPVDAIVGGAALGRGDGVGSALHAVHHAPPGGNTSSGISGVEMTDGACLIHVANALRFAVLASESPRSTRRPALSCVAKRKH